MRKMCEREEKYYTERKGIQETKKIYSHYNDILIYTNIFFYRKICISSYKP